MTLWRLGKIDGLRRFLLGAAVVCLCAGLMMCDRRNASSVSAGESATSPPATHVGRFRFLALGDSYTIGQSVPAADRWPVQLAELLRQRGLNVSDPLIIARTGWTTGNLLDALDQARLRPDYQLVMLLIGVNNQFQGRSEQEYRQQLVQLLNRSVQLAGGDAHRVVVLSIPDWSVTPFGAGFDAKRMSREIDQFNAINREEAIRAGAAFVDVTPESRNAATHPELVADDGAAAALAPAPTTVPAHPSP